MVLLLILAAILTVFIVESAVYSVYCKQPYRYPYLVIEMDVSGKRNVKFLDELDRYLCKHSIGMFRQHECYVESWKKETEAQIAKSLLWFHRRKQYEEILDDDNMFVFVMVRQQTRYCQSNYVRVPYKTVVEVHRAYYNLKRIEKRYELLSGTDFQCTLRQYRTREQRKLMTKDLRDQIKKRDDYTCQICGRYMPDEVGLHIDHIVPVSKGGKSIPSNLQVLCSKCNGKKSNK